jgi:hypothetical protein
MRVRTGAAFVHVISAEDGAAHLVAFRLFEEGLMSGDGRFAATCGKTVLAASMTTARTRPCLLCHASPDGPGRRIPPRR